MYQLIFSKTLKSKTVNLTWHAYQTLSMYRPAHAVERSLIENDTYYIWFKIQKLLASPFLKLTLGLIQSLPITDWAITYDP